MAFLAMVVPVGDMPCGLQSNLEMEHKSTGKESEILIFRTELLLPDSVVEKFNEPVIEWSDKYFAWGYCSPSGKEGFDFSENPRPFQQRCRIPQPDKQPKEQKGVQKEAKPDNDVEFNWPDLGEYTYRIIEENGVEGFDFSEYTEKEEKEAGIERFRNDLGKYLDNTREYLKLTLRDLETKVMKEIASSSSKREMEEKGKALQYGLENESATENDFYVHGDKPLHEMHKTVVREYLKEILEYYKNLEESEMEKDVQSFRELNLWKDMRVLKTLAEENLFSWFLEDWGHGEEAVPQEEIKQVMRDLTSRYFNKTCEYAEFIFNKVSADVQDFEGGMKDIAKATEYLENAYKEMEAQGLDTNDVHNRKDAFLEKFGNLKQILDNCKTEQEMSAP